MTLRKEINTLKIKPWVKHTEVSHITQKKEGLSATCASKRQLRTEAELQCFQTVPDARFALGRVGNLPGQKVRGIESPALVILSVTNGSLCKYTLTEKHEETHFSLNLFSLLIPGDQSLGLRVSSKASRAGKKHYSTGIVTEAHGQSGQQG